MEEHGFDLETISKNNDISKQGLQWLILAVTEI